MKRTKKLSQRRKAEDAESIWFAFYGKELSLAQLRARLKDLGWTDEEIDDALDDNQGD